jgi:subtilisin family serine protease
MKLTNVRGVPYIGAPSVWDGVAGLHGEGIKIGIIDTGLDYTHANFGGPGTVGAIPGG